MRVSRRAALRAAAAGGAVVAFPDRALAASDVRPTEGTTLAVTVRRGPAGAGGYVSLVAGPGEPHRLRDGLGVRPRTGRQSRRRALLAFAHLTDVHVIDAQSPGRLELTDRLDDGPVLVGLFSSAYRPQEVLTTQTADSIVSAVERVGRGPASERRLDFAVCTGDNTDNAQLNELRWQIDVLDGIPVRPDSGDTSRYEGVADGDPASYDVHYWHPEGTPAGRADDLLRRTRGFPVVPGLLDAARRPFTPVGLSIPWYSCFGNHDGLVQGNFPVALAGGARAFDALLTGSLKPTSAGLSPADLADPGALLDALAAAPARVVTPDARRRTASRAETVKEHFATGGRPLGHGYTARNLAEGTAHYAFDPAPGVRGLVLDTVNPNGESGGSLDPDQLVWLEAELARATRQRRLVVVFSHHTSSTMDNQLLAAGGDVRLRVTGERVVALLLRFPACVLWVCGHTHENRVTPHRRPAGGGFWEVSTASHVDWPSQARLFELLDNRDGTLSVLTTMLDADAPLSAGRRTGSTRALASLARELAANDPQERSDARLGDAADRNVELLLPRPFAPVAGAAPSPSPSAPAPSGGGDPGGEGGALPATGPASALGPAAAAALAAAALAARAAPRPADDGA